MNRRTFLGVLGCACCEAQKTSGQEYASGRFITNGRIPLERIEELSFTTVVPKDSVYHPSQHSSMTFDTKRNQIVLTDQQALAFFSPEGKYIRECRLFNNGRIPDKSFGAPEWRYRYQDSEGIAYLAASDTFLLAMEDQYHIHQIDPGGNLITDGISIQAELGFPSRWGANMEGCSPVDDDASLVWFVQEKWDAAIAAVDLKGKLKQAFRSDAEDLSDIFYEREHQLLLVLSHESGSITLLTPEGRFVESFGVRYGPGSANGNRCLHKAEGLFWRDQKVWVCGEGPSRVEVFHLPLSKYVPASRDRVAINLGFRSLPPIQEKFLMHLSISDFPQGWGKSDRTWGAPAIRALFADVRTAGIRTVNWRVTCSGAMNYPTAVNGADVYKSELGKGGELDFGSWDSMREAVREARSTGMEIFAWYDQTDSHGGCGPQSVHNSFLLGHPDTIRCPEEEGRHSAVEISEHRRKDCPLAGKGTQASLSFPEVQQFRLHLIREMVEAGFDGVYIVDYGLIGYEAPVMRAFRATYRQQAGTPVDPLDPRLIEIQSGVLRDYLKRVRAVTASGPRPCRLMLECRGRSKRTTGLRPYTRHAMPHLFRERVIDAVVVWVDEDVFALRDELGVAPERIHRRYEIPDGMPSEGVRSIFDGLLAAWVGCIHIDEATTIERVGWTRFSNLMRDYQEAK